MKTQAFKRLVEAAIRAEYDLESDFDKVPYLDSDGTSTVARECIGVFLHDGEDVDTDDLTIKFGDLVDSLLSDFRQDAMGHEVVVYWPKLTKPEESEDGA